MLPNKFSVPTTSYKIRFSFSSINSPWRIESRKTFGHWEIDTVIGSKHKDDAVLLTLVERQTRFEVLLKIDGKDVQPVTEAIESLVERTGNYIPSLFKTITSDNGSEFSTLHDHLKHVTH